jgi:hypothetical protein
MAKKTGKNQLIVELDIDRSGVFFVDDWILEIPVYSASGGILLKRQYISWIF